MKLKVKKLLKMDKGLEKESEIYIYDNDMKPVYASTVEDFFKYKKEKCSQPDFIEFGLKATVECFWYNGYDLMIVANEKFNGEV